MNPCKTIHREYVKYLLNKATVTPNIISHIEMLSIKIDTPNYSFHKIMIKHWTGSQDTLFNTMADYFTSALIPINPYYQDEVISFWTSNLNLILKIIKFKFIFYYERDMFNVDIVFNDRMAVDFFNKYEMENDIVSEVVNSRYNDECELDLSDFRNDAHFLKKKIVFFNINMLSYFKSVMLKVGKNTKSLDLSRNNLSLPPVPILNFFITGELTSLNLSHNNICNLSDIFSNELFAFNKKIVQLWLEGNPLCDELDTCDYIKNIVARYHKLTTLDGIKLHPNRVLPPFIRNYLATPDMPTKCIVTKFLMNYFKAYDEPRRPAINQFYDIDCTFSISTQYTEDQEHVMAYYNLYGRNFCDSHKKPADTLNKQVYRRRSPVVTILRHLPVTIHDLTSFNVQVLNHGSQYLIVVIDGLFFESHNNKEVHKKFSRTFTFKIYRRKTSEKHAMYFIINDMLFVRPPWNYEIKNFRCPLTKPEKPLALVDPSEEEKTILLKIFVYITHLKIPDAIQRLESSDWDLRPALINVTKQISNNALMPEDFEHNDDTEIMDES